jgi:acyl carrier protein phosphodiesterase
MNHIAHCFLSFGDPEVLLGNCIGDVIKGRQWEGYPSGIQKGILLHRYIDAFTDAHWGPLEGVRQLRPIAGRYASPILDILYDHLLFRNWNAYATDVFDVFAETVFVNLNAQHTYMPEPLFPRWPRMLEGRFLYAYTTPEALESVLRGFVARYNIPADADALGAYFWDHIDVFEKNFNLFFPEMVLAVQQKGLTA